MRVERAVHPHFKALKPQELEHKRQRIAGRRAEHEGRRGAPGWLNTPTCGPHRQLRETWYGKKDAGGHVERLQLGMKHGRSFLAWVLQLHSGIA